MPRISFVELNLSAGSFSKQRITIAAIRAGKKLLNSNFDGTIAEGLRREAEIQISLIGKPNQIETVMSVLEKRPPKYQDPE